MVSGNGPKPDEIEVTFAFSGVTMVADLPLATFARAQTLILPHVQVVRADEEEPGVVVAPKPKARKGMTRAEAASLGGKAKAAKTLEPEVPFPPPKNPKRSKRGRRGAGAKEWEAAVELIVKGWPDGKIAAKMGVTTAAVSSTRLGKSWCWLSGFTPYMLRDPNSLHDRAHLNRLPNGNPTRKAAQYVRKHVSGGPYKAHRSALFDRIAELYPDLVVKDDDGVGTAFAQV